jgi:hypothetical protein
VVAEVNALLAEGIHIAGAKTRLIAWDWGWQDGWAPAAIGRLPRSAALMSVSEWSVPITRGGVSTTVGEYSLSAVGPGPRATAHWQAARHSGLETFAKLQVGTTWELGSVPYLPAVHKVAEHVGHLRSVGVNGVMLGWTLGGFPSANLEVAAKVLDGEPAETALRSVAVRRYGDRRATTVLASWRHFSDALDEYPYHGSVVYTSPHHVGPANLLWSHPTGYKATMVGIPYDDLNSWRGVYPPETFAAQFTKVADGFDRGLESLRAAGNAADEYQTPFQGELRVAEAAAIQFRSAANQARFVMARDRLAAGLQGAEADRCLNDLESLITAELDLARRLYKLQIYDARLGFEATNHYFFTPMDLAEKALNCRYLLDHWLPDERAKASVADSKLSAAP